MSKVLRATFESSNSFHRFERSTKRVARYIRSAESEKFLAAVLEAAKRRTTEIPAGVYLYRAQLGADETEDQLLALPSAKMKPSANRAFEGRANPKGIPCLYLATKTQTAMAEVRPWDGSFISLWSFKTVRTLRIVNLKTGRRRRRGRGIGGDEPTARQREKRVWEDIGRAFARPVTRSDDVADYVPTQIISELFKQNGFDGIAYGSWLGPGHNIALFDLNAADPHGGAPHEVATSFRRSADAVCFRFRQVGNSRQIAGSAPAKRRVLSEFRQYPSPQGWLSLLPARDVRAV